MSSENTDFPFSWLREPEKNKAKDAVNTRMEDFFPRSSPPLVKRPRATDSSTMPYGGKVDKATKVPGDTVFSRDASDVKQSVVEMLPASDVDV
jgi:hypothetical protein